MLQFEWNDEYAIDHGQIDEQHRVLIRMANRVFTIAGTEANRDMIVDLVKALFRYMEKHFEHEERLMRDVEYPAFAAHVTQHQEIVEEMTTALREKQELNDYLASLRRLMVDWVIRHIADDDQKIAAFLPRKHCTA